MIDIKITKSPFLMNFKGPQGDVEVVLHSSRWTVVGSVCRIQRPGIKFQGLDFDVQKQQRSDFKHQLKLFFFSPSQQLEGRL